MYQFEHQVVSELRYQGRETWRFRHVDHLLFLSLVSFTSESVRDDSEKMYCLMLGLLGCIRVFCFGVLL
jgi:hypothetical protein